MLGRVPQKTRPASPNDRDPGPIDALSCDEVAASIAIQRVFIIRMDGVWYIDYLAHHARAISQLACWHHDEWSSLNPQSTVDRRIESLRQHLHTDHIPLTLVAVADDAVIGSASLIEHDLHTHLELSPWLASVYVAPAYRRRGIGSALVRRVVDEAFRFGVTTLYLFTPDRENFYRRLGWQVVEHIIYHGHPVTIMSINAAEDGYQSSAALEG